MTAERRYQSRCISDSTIKAYIQTSLAALDAERAEARRWLLDALHTPVPLKRFLAKHDLVAAAACLQDYVVTMPVFNAPMAVRRWLWRQRFGIAVQQPLSILGMQSARWQITDFSTETLFRLRDLTTPCGVCCMPEPFFEASRVPEPRMIRNVRMTRHSWTITMAVNDRTLALSGKIFAVDDIWLGECEECRQVYWQDVLGEENSRVVTAMLEKNRPWR